MEIFSWLYSLNVIDKMKLKIKIDFIQTKANMKKCKIFYICMHIKYKKVF